MLAPFRKAWRRNAPQSLQIAVALGRRRVRDRLTGMAKDIVKPVQTQPLGSFTEVISLTQPIRKTPYWEGKLSNLRVAAERLNWIVLPPKGILSFWAAVGEPVERNGFHLGRSIRSDAVGADIGGGLCQISGLVYETGLRAGLEIVERQAHSQDLYTDETRFAPLGLDATVVWGHKDVRLRNNTAHALAFSFDVTTDEIRARLWSERPLEVARVTIVDENSQAGGRRVSVFRETGSERVLISSDVYRPLDQILNH